jgi:hypothetical protein
MRGCRRTSIEKVVGDGVWRLREIAADVALTGCKTGFGLARQSRSAVERAEAAGGWRCSMVTSSQKVLVQNSFASLAPIVEDVAALFYRKLF